LYFYHGERDTNALIPESIGLAVSILLISIVNEYGLRREWRVVLVLYMLWNIVAIVYIAYKNIRIFLYTSSLNLSSIPFDRIQDELIKLRLILTFVSAWFILWRLMTLGYQIFVAVVYYGKNMRTMVFAKMKPLFIYRWIDSLAMFFWRKTCAKYFTSNDGQHDEKPKAVHATGGKKQQIIELEEE